MPTSRTRFPENENFPFSTSPQRALTRSNAPSHNLSPPTTHKVHAFISMYFAIIQMHDFSTQKPKVRGRAEEPGIYQLDIQLPSYLPGTKSELDKEKTS